MMEGKAKPHELKIRKEYLEAVEAGLKRFELRRDDRGYAVGDSLRFLVPDGAGGWKRSGREYEVVYILRGCPAYGLMEGFCILGIAEMPEGKGREGND